MGWRRGEQGEWCPVDIGADEDLLKSTKDLREGWYPPMSRPAEHIFLGLRDALVPYAETPAESFAVTSRDTAQWDSTPLDKATNAFFLIQDRDDKWVGLQYQRETIVFRRGLISALELSMGYPTARGRGGFDIAATLSTAVTADRAQREVDSTTGGSLRFGMDYHLSEAGGFRILKVLLAMGELLSVPVRLAEYSDV